MKQATQNLTPSYHLKTTNKVQNVKHCILFVFFFMLACERIFIKTHTTDSRCVIGPENVLFLRWVLASFSPGILQAGAA